MRQTKNMRTFGVSLYTLLKIQLIIPNDTGIKEWEFSRFQMFLCKGKVLDEIRKETEAEKYRIDRTCFIN